MIDFETKRQKVLAYIKGLKTMPVVVTKGPAPEPVAVIDGVKYFHKQEFDLKELASKVVGSVYDVKYNLLGGENIGTDSYLYVTTAGNTYPKGICRLVLASGYGPYFAFDLQNFDSWETSYTSRAFAVVDTQEEVTDNTKICLPTCSAYYGFLSEDGKTFISYYNLKDDGAPTETIMVPVYDQNGVDPAKIEALKAVAAGGKVGEELLDELVDFIDTTYAADIEALPAA